MATQAILRTGIVSPTRATLKRAASTRSILKRPVSLSLSPASASFSVQHSPLLRSSHVKFLPSPSLVSTFTAHSARSYDRAPISVSPLERTYVTSLEDFKLSAPPKPFRSISSAAQSSPAITDFEDPRSPKVQPAAKQNLLRFATFTSGNQTVTRPSRTLASSLASYPRSPYPSAPLVPTEQTNDVAVAADSQRARASSLELPRRNKKGLTLGGPSSFIPVAAPTPSSLGRSVFSPSVNNNGKVPAPLDLESRLSEDFWMSVHLEDSAKSEDDEVMVTALEYPSSAFNDSHQIMYASADGALWSPALPKQGAAVNRIRESLMSAPSKRSSFGGNIIRKDFTAPTPNDPFAAFPSFAAAMELDSAMIAYPSRVVLD